MSDKPFPISPRFEAGSLDGEGVGDHDQPFAGFRAYVSTRASWLYCFKYAVKYWRHGWVTVGGRLTFYRPTDTLNTAEPGQLF
jgi:hypothetical protein